MRRRRITALLLALLAIAPAYAAASSETVPQAAKAVRSAIPAIEAYRADRGTYVGLTLARIRAYDRAVRGVAVKRAAKNGYCLQSTAPGPVVHYDGPRGPVRKGRCGVRGAVVAQPAPKPPATSDAAATAQTRLRAAVPAIEVYAADNGGYTGLTLAKIRVWDYGVQGISVVWAQRSEYCIQSTVGAVTYHLRGPAHSVAPGRCPAAP
ncbi:MAG TPA: hypothetical protein VNP89_09885 [Gaiellaceae bacterium]|nr:hypothetical protein [Gaiellaceae bacterium]